MIPGNSKLPHLFLHAGLGATLRCGKASRVPVGRSRGKGHAKPVHLGFTKWDIPNKWRFKRENNLYSSINGRFAMGSPLQMEVQQENQLQMWHFPLPRLMTGGYSHDSNMTEHMLFDSSRHLLSGPSLDHFRVTQILIPKEQTAIIIFTKKPNTKHTILYIYIYIQNLDIYTDRQIDRQMDGWMVRQIDRYGG